MCERTVLKSESFRKLLVDNGDSLWDKTELCVYGFLISLRVL